MVEGNQDDRLSSLPDHILLSILDRFSVREAARTSFLSTRWRQLPAMLSQLRIDVWDFLPMDASTCQGDEIVQSNAGVVEATKSILGRRDSSRNTIQLLCMTFFLRDDDSIAIGDAVGHAMATQKVDIAEFIVLTERNNIGRDDDDLVNYGRRFMSFFDACKDAFGGLTRLHLQNMRFGESDISNVLNTCKRLEHLHLFNCDSGSTAKLQVEHMHLSELAIVDCSFERVVLSLLPKLTRLAFEGWISFQDPISFGHVPVLEAVGLSNVGLSWHRMVKLSKFLGDISVRDLKLRFNCEKIWVQPEPVTKRLAWISFQDPISFGHVPVLEAVGLSNVGLSWHRMVKLSKFLGDISVRDLKLRFNCEKIWVQPEPVTKRLAYVFRQLRFVNLDEIPEGYDLTWTLFILEAAPNVKELYMTVRYCKLSQALPPLLSVKFCKAFRTEQK